MAAEDKKTGASTTPRQIAEVHPNPHGEQDVAEMPLQTDHSVVTSENMGQSPSTRENRMQPSVTGPLEDPTTDSMFNVADPQTQAIEESTRKDGSRQKKTRKSRKAA